jgi:hypothetical protein
MSAWLAIGLALGAATVVFVLWARTRLNYRIIDGHVEIRWLSLRLRRFPLADIEGISKYRHAWAEHWENTWRPAHKRLVIHRRRGWLRDIVITPSYRYEFMRELEALIETNVSSAPAQK